MAEQKTSVEARRSTKARNALTSSDIKSPVDLENLTPTSFGITITEVGETTEDTFFTLDENLVRTLQFTEPGKQLPSKRLFTVKAFNPGGTLVQLPFENQIQNTKASDRHDAIGLRKYQAKGFHILYDFAEGRTVYCAAWDCWAQARPGDDFCCDRHRTQTVPDNSGGRFGDGATTSRGYYS